MGQIKFGNRFRRSVPVRKAGFRGSTGVREMLEVQFQFLLILILFVLFITFSKFNSTPVLRDWCERYRVRWRRNESVRPLVKALWRDWCYLRFENVLSLSKIQALIRTGAISINLEILARVHLSPAPLVTEHYKSIAFGEQWQATIEWVREQLLGVRSGYWRTQAKRTAYREFHLKIQSEFWSFVDDFYFFVYF